MRLALWTSIRLKSYGRLVGQKDMSHAGDELLTSGGTPAVPALPYAPHPHGTGAIWSSGINHRVHILDTNRIRASRDREGESNPDACSATATPHRTRCTADRTASS